MFDSTVRSRHLIALYHLWNGKRGQRILPARADFDPLEMVSLLPHLYMLDVVPGAAAGARGFRYRLIGTSIVELLGRDSTGKWVAPTLHGDATTGLRRVFELVCDKRSPVVTKGYIFYIWEKSWIFVEALLLPLSADGMNVDIILAGLVQTEAPSGQLTSAREADAIEIFADPAMQAFADPVIEGRSHADRGRG